jgi:hypothetical protein
MVEEEMKGKSDGMVYSEGTHKKLILGDSLEEGQVS